VSLPTVIQTLLEGRTVRVAHLVEFGFCTQVRRLHNGNYTLTAGGHEWFGLRKMGAIDGLDDEGPLQASQKKFTVSAVDARFLATAIAEDRSEIIGRIGRTWLAFFDEDWQVVDEPVARDACILDGMEVSKSSGDKGQTWQRVATITGENIFYGRGTPSNGYFTPSDQRQRHPGDRGLDPVWEIQEAVIEVPWVG
jgi:hypothetical protein